MGSRLSSRLKRISSCDSIRRQYAGCRRNCDVPRDAAQDPRLQILMLTVRDREADKIEALDAGPMTIYETLLHPGTGGPPALRGPPLHDDEPDRCTHHDR